MSDDVTAGCVRLAQSQRGDTMSSYTAGEQNSDQMSNYSRRYVLFKVNCAVGRLLCDVILIVTYLDARRCVKAVYIQATHFPAVT